MKLAGFRAKGGVGRRSLAALVGGALGMALVGGGLVYAGSRGRDAAAPWYDPAPLQASLRPETRAGVTRALGVLHDEDVTLYDLDLNLATDASKTQFSEDEDIYFTNTTAAPLPDLVFRIYANAAPPPSGPEVRLLSGSCVGDDGCAISAVNPSAIRVQPSKPVAPGQRLHVRLVLKGTLTQIASGRTSFASQGMEGLLSILGGGTSAGDYGLLAVGDGISSFSNFYPVLARRQGAGWETNEASTLGDLGSDVMANFRARIQLPARAKLAVTGVVTAESPAPPAADGSARRSVDVVAAAIRDFALNYSDAYEVASRDVNGVHVHSYFLASDRAEGDRVLDVAAQALADFERRFGPYPYADYGVAEAAIVGGAGGVEFSGLVTAASMFYRAGGPAAPTASPAPSSGEEGLGGMIAQLGGLGGLGGAGSTEGMLEFVVAHETAHQWWHGLVGSDSRDHPYVDEALAQYSSILYLEDRYGAARAEKDGSQNVKMNFQTMRILGKPDAPADQPVAAFTASMQYAGIIYGKAPYLYPAIRQAIGDAAFFAALKEYVVRYRFQVAPARGLVDILAAGREGVVRPIEHHWLDEAHGDKDLGAVDVGGLMGGLMGGAGGLGALGGADSMGQIQDIMKALQGASGAFPGGGGGAAGPGPTPLMPGGGGGAEPGDLDMKELLKTLGGSVPE